MEDRRRLVVDDALQELLVGDVARDLIDSRIAERRRFDDVDERELRAYARERLAAFKVPRRIVIVSEIPKGPTGKVQRIGMAERLGLVPG